MAEPARVIIKRVYDEPAESDGMRVLVDRLWPRGLSKERAHIDLWLKEIAPSNELRAWFGHDPARWDEFQRRYRAELAEPERRHLIDELAARAAHGPVTLIYGARDTAHNETVRAKLGALAEAASEVGDLQVRARGTIGGSLAHADSAADEPAPTLAYDATIRAIGPKGRRDIAARDYFKGTFETALAANEILAEIRFPAPAGRTGGAYAKFAHPASGFAVIGVAARSMAPSALTVTMVRPALRLRTFSPSTASCIAMSRSR